MAKIGIDARMYSGFHGIGRYVARLIDYIQNLDNKNEYVIFTTKQQIQNIPKRDEKIRVVEVDAPHYSLKEQVNFLKALNKESLDLVHFPHFNVPLLYSRKYVVTIHDITLSIFPGQSRTSWLHKFAYNTVIRNATKRAEKVIAISKHSAKDINEYLGIAKEKIETIYEAGGEEFHPKKEHSSEVLKKYNISQPYILHTGNWRTHKNIPCLIDAFNSLCKEYNDITLVLTGKAEGKNKAQEMIEASPNKDRIKSLGFIDPKDMAPIMNHAFMYVFPSFYEGFGLPPLEAMSSGVPVIIANATALPEICGDAGLKFDPSSPNELVSQMKKYLEHTDIRKKAIEKGLQRVNQFSWKKMAQETLDLYKTVIK